MVAIFARQVNDDLTGLVKKIEKATVDNKSAKLSSFVIMCSDTKNLSKELNTFADKEAIKNTIFAIDNVTGPEGYKIAKDAEVTVVLYVKKKVKANYAFKKGELTTEAVDKIIKELPKITTKE